MDGLKAETMFWNERTRTMAHPGLSQPRPITPVENAGIGMGLDESLPFYPLRIAVLTVSDSRKAATDGSGDLLAKRLVSAGHELVKRAVVKDEVEAIRVQIGAWVGDEAIDLILATGGTGFAPRDVTPEAVRPLFRREMDGFAALFHHASFGTVGFSTLQSRACAGQIEDTFVFCLPGSTGACRDAWDLVLRFEFDSRYRPCSLAGQIPRLRHLCA
jgi:molybdenum cofactor biosynthesis protein B